MSQKAPHVRLDEHGVRLCEHVIRLVGSRAAALLDESIYHTVIICLFKSTFQEQPSLGWHTGCSSHIAISHALRKKTFASDKMQPTSQRPKIKSNHNKMRATLAGALILILAVTLWTAPADAQTEPEENMAIAVIKFGAGVISAYALHEVGHATAAYLTDTDIEWGLGTYNQPLGFTENADSDNDGMILHASGLVTQLAVSEVILQAESITNNDSFVRGMMFWNIFNPIVYALDYWFIRRTNKETETTYQGDIEGFENYTDDTSANVFAASMATIAALQGYRYIETQTWAPQWMKSDDFRLNLHARGRAGISLMVEIDF
jgi:hypothetical protein